MTTKKIKERKRWCDKRLYQLFIARETFQSTDRCYAYASGRIRELENEKAFLESLLKQES